MSEHAEHDRRTAERASTWDRWWFAARPGREYRLRKRLPFELGAPDFYTHVLVRQVRPGHRIRTAIPLLGDWPDKDSVLEELWHCAEQGWLPVRAQAGGT